MTFSPSRPGFQKSLWVVALLTLLTLFAFGVRIANLSAAGFAEDEINKIQAVESYKTGDFTANPEHPMLMKLAMMASLKASEWIEEALPGRGPAPETALRLPNAIVGALTTVVLGWLAAELFGANVGLIAAGLWATGVLAIAVNRIGKEDTFLVFFLTLAQAAYFHAKWIGATHGAAGLRRQKLWYLVSGVSLGLMVASKYFPHYWGLLFLSEFLSSKIDPKHPLNNPIPRPAYWFLYPGMALAFLIANPVALLPSVMRDVINYAGQETVTHHGYLLMGKLFFNDPSHSAFSGGLPLSFYALMLFVKLNPLVLLGLIVGLCVALRNFKQTPYFFILFHLAFWLVPFSIIGGKWMRYTQTLMPLALILAAVGFCAIGKFIAGLAHRWREAASGTALQSARRAGGVLAALAICASAIDSLRSTPHYGLYVSPLAGGKEFAGFYFPHDEFYDAGVREALAEVARTAAPGATVVTETPKVAEHYFTKWNRRDLRVCILSDPSNFLPSNPGVTYCLLQSGRTYFENLERRTFIQRAAHQRTPILIADQVAAEVYELTAENARRLLDHKPPLLTTTRQ
jgi:hypothetical protein